MTQLIPNYADPVKFPQYQADVAAYIKRADYKEIKKYLCFKEFKFFQLKGRDPLQLVEWRKKRYFVSMRINKDGTEDLQCAKPMASEPANRI